jgi:hypothetical protein
VSFEEASAHVTLVEQDDDGAIVLRSDDAE